MFRIQEGVQMTEWTRLHGRRILVVEDDYFIAQDLFRVLQAAGALVAGPVARIADAREALAVQTVDAAVLNINLHAAEDVYGLARQLRERTIPFVFATGYEKSAIPEEFSQVPHLLKPFGNEVLLRVLCAQLPPHS